MYKSYKSEIRLRDEQKIQLTRAMGICRFLYNLYLAHNKEVYEQDSTFVSAFSFNNWLNHEYLIDNPGKIWIKEASSDARDQAIANAERAFKNFFKHNARYPNFKKKGRDQVGYAFRSRNNNMIQIERHRIKVPKLGWVQLKRYGYIPYKDAKIKSATISCEANKYYVSVLIEEKDKTLPILSDEGIGVDVGIKEFLTCSNGLIKENINKTKKVKKLEKKLKREQRKLSRKMELNKNNKSDDFTKSNIYKQRLVVQVLYQRLKNIRHDYVNQSVAEIVKLKPSFITLEDLNVRGMMKNKHLAKAIAQQDFNYFKNRIMQKCNEYGIELRIVDRWYPSSKLCHECGCIKKDLKLKDRIYKCECGNIIDRDYQASLNLRDALTYKLA